MLEFLLKKNKPSKGFTMIELLIVMGITAVLGGVAMSNYFGYQSSVSVDNAASELLGTLRDAQQRAISQDEQAAWGVRITAVSGANDYYELFYGDSYATGTILSRTTLSGDLDFYAPVQGTTLEIVFTKSTGLPSNDRAIAIISKRNSSMAKSIILNTSTGLISAVSGLSCGDAVSYNGKSYPRVLIGSQCWLAKNLDYDNGCSVKTWVDSTDVGWCGYYTGGPFTDEGLLYQWSAAMNGSVSSGAQGLCPTGWHIPTDAEFCTLEQYVDPSITCNSTGWRGVIGGTKLLPGGSSNFNSILTGYRHDLNNGEYIFRNTLTVIWSSDNGWVRSLAGGNVTIYRGGLENANGFSIRCLKNQ